MAMTATRKELEDKIPALEHEHPDFRSHVKITGPHSAHVQSFTNADRAPYTTSIRVGDTPEEFIVVCTCDSRVTCVHMAAYFAARQAEKQPEPHKPDEPANRTNTPPQPKKAAGGGTGDTPEVKKEPSGMQMVGTAIEELVNGIGLLVREQVKAALEEERKATKTTKEE